MHGQGYLYWHTDNHLRMVMVVVALCCTRQNWAPNTCNIDCWMPEIWPWPRPLTLTLKQCNSDVQMRFLAFDLDLWPANLTYNPSQAKVKVDPHPWRKVKCQTVFKQESSDKQTDKLTNKQTDERMLPSTLSPCFAVDNNNKQYYSTTFSFVFLLGSVLVPMNPVYSSRFPVHSLIHKPQYKHSLGANGKPVFPNLDLFSVWLNFPVQIRSLVHWLLSLNIFWSWMDCNWHMRLVHLEMSHFGEKNWALVSCIPCHHRNSHRHGIQFLFRQNFI